MSAQLRRTPSHAIEYRAFDDAGQETLSRFYREAGFPVAIMPGDEGWGAWDRGVLVGCLALSHEANTWIMRGPEIKAEYRRRGVGAHLLNLAMPRLRGKTCYCVSYTFLMRMYSRAGFHACPPHEQPAFLAKRVARLRDQGWDLKILRRLPG